MDDDTDLTRAVNRLSEIRQRVADQEARVRRLVRVGSPTHLAEETLANLKRSQAICERNVKVLNEG